MASTQLKLRQLIQDGASTDDVIIWDGSEWVAGPLPSLDGEQVFIEGYTGSTVDLDANDGTVKDAAGTNVAFTTPANLDNLFVYKNGVRLDRDGVGARDYSINPSTHVITFNVALTTADVVTIWKGHPADPSGGVTDLAFAGASSPVTLTSSTGTDVTFTAGTNVTLSQAGNNLTINASGGGATNLTFTGASSPYTLASDTGTDVTFTSGTGISLSRSSNELTIASTLVGLTDGDKGDITVSGTGATWTIDNTAVTYAKIQNVAANSFLANLTGSPAALTEVATNRIPLFSSAITGTPSASTYLRGDGTWATVSGSGDIVNGGQNGPITIGTNDATVLNLEQGGVNVMTINTDKTTSFVVENAVTNDITYPINLYHNSTGTPTTNYGTGIQFFAESATVADRLAGRLDAYWTTATDATRSSRLRFTVVTNGTATSPVTIGPSGLYLSTTLFQSSGITYAGNATIESAAYTSTSSGVVSFIAEGTAAVAFGIDVTNNGATATSQIELGWAGRTYTQTSGTRNLVNLSSSFSPTSGTAEHTRLLLGGTINQTGGASGITRWAYINPTLTATADFRGLDIAIDGTNTGGSARKAIYQSGSTAVNTLAGATSIGTTSVPDVSAVLDIVSTTKGLGLPSMTTAQRTSIGTPRDGLMVYDADLDKIYLRANGAWEQVGGSGSGDVVGPASSVDSEIALFDSTTGKLLKRASGTGVAIVTSGVLSTKTNPTGAFVGDTDNQTLTTKTISVDNNTISGIAASSFVLSNGSGNIDGAAAQKAIPSGVVVGTTDTQTLSAKRIDPRVTSVTTSAAPTPDVSTTDLYLITALAEGATFGSPTGTPVQGTKLIIRVKDNGTARSLNYNAIYRAVGVTLPTTTVINKTLYLGMIYNSTDARWDIIAVAQEA